VQLVELPVAACAPAPLDARNDGALDAEYRHVLYDDGEERQRKEGAEADPDDDPPGERLHVEQRYAGDRRDGPDDGREGEQDGEAPADGRAGPARVLVDLISGRSL
jgi:hypothetical protein